MVVGIKGVGAKAKVRLMNRARCPAMASAERLGQLLKSLPLLPVAPVDGDLVTDAQGFTV